jgi:hypothetical protein
VKVSASQLQQNDYYYFYYYCYYGNVYQSTAASGAFSIASTIDLWIRSLSTTEKRVRARTIANTEQWQQTVFDFQFQLSSSKFETSFPFLLAKERSKRQRQAQK